MVLGIAAGLLAGWLGERNSYARESAHSYVKVRLLSRLQSVRPGESFDIAIHQTIERRWHTYWKNPGDSGLASRMQWRLPVGVKASPLLWPLPQRLRQRSLVNYGYEKEVTLLSRIVLPRAWSHPQVVIAGTFSWLVCHDVCIPGKAQLRLVVPVKSIQPQLNPAVATYFRRALATLPQHSASLRASLREKGRWLLLRIKGLTHKLRSLTRLEFFPITDGIVHNAAPQQCQRVADGWLLRLQKHDYFGVEGRYLKGVLVTIEAPAKNAPSQRPASKSWTIEAQLAPKVR